MKKIIFLMLVLFIGSIYAADNTITIYHNNYGVLTEKIEFDLSKGKNVVDYKDIPLALDSNSVILLPMWKGDFVLQTQSYLQKTADLNSYLQSNLQEEVEIITEDGLIVKGVMFYFDYNMIGVIEKGREKLYRVEKIKSITLSDKGYNFVPFSHLSWKLSTAKVGKFPAKLTYMFSGISWEAQYKGIWDGSELQLDITASLSNNSGRSFNDFLVYLIAGEPKKTAIESQSYKGLGMRTASFSNEMMSDSYAPQFETESFDEYHLYSYPEKINLAHNSSKQIRLYPTKQLKPEVYYEYITHSQVLLTKLKIMNDNKSGLGIVLPKGKMQIYRVNPQSQELSFIGEEHIPQKPIDEELLISPGKSFDLVGETKELARRNPARNVTEKDMMVKVSNRSKEDKSVEIKHRLSGNWTVSKETMSYEKFDSNTIVFKKSLKANEILEIKWTETVQY